MGLNWDLGSRVSLVSDFPKLETLTDKNLAACLRNDQPIDDSAVVDDMFGFLEDQKDNVSESQAPSAFRDLPAPKVLNDIMVK